MNKLQNKDLAEFFPSEVFLYSFLRVDQSHRGSRTGGLSPCARVPVCDGYGCDVRLF